jgi:cell fate (sporulation/competence/biofilm development) regulator YlbF (YheA/YmcA/DUF963 family)
MMRQEWLEATENLIAELLDSSLYKTLETAHVTLHQAKDLEPLIERYTHDKSRFDEARRFGQHHPDLKAIKAAFQASKTALFNDVRVQTYLSAHSALQAFLSTLATRLGESVSKSIKAPLSMRAFMEEPHG